MQHLNNIPPAPRRKPSAAKVTGTIIAYSVVLLTSALFIGVLVKAVVWAWS